jgi:tetratricopeptide (TPR) repeat protein
MSGLMTGLALTAFAGCTTAGTPAPPVGASVLTVQPCVAQNRTSSRDAGAALQISFDFAETALRSNPPNYADAIRGYETAAAAENLRLRAYSGLGEAYLGQANYQRASDCYVAAASQAERDGAPTQRANAHEGRAKALSALNSADARVRAAVVSELQSAIRYGDTAERQFALGGAYASDFQTENAIAAYRAGLARGTTDRSVEAAAGAALGKLLLDSNRSTEALPVLEAALLDNPNSLEVNAMIGRLYFARAGSGDMDAARTAFTRVISPSATTAGGSTQETALARAEAYYHLSVIATQGSPTPAGLEEAIRNADSAGAEPRYRRQACLARIMRGGEWVMGDANARACDFGTTPEGYLFRGVFQVRWAQQIEATNVNARRAAEWREHVSAAESAFSNGLRAATDRSATIALPGQPGDVRIGDLLEYGSSVIARGCLGLSQLAVDSQVEASGRSFFARYNANNCRPRS